MSGSVVQGDTQYVMVKMATGDFLYLPFTDPADPQCVKLITPQGSVTKLSLVLTMLLRGLCGSSAAVIVVS